MSNDPLLGLDSMELVETKDSKWVTVRKHKARGFAVATKAYDRDEDGDVFYPTKADPVHKVTAVAAECHTQLHDPRVAPAYVVTKPSWLQRVLDYLCS